MNACCGQANNCPMSEKSESECITSRHRADFHISFFDGVPIGPPVQLWPPIVHKSLLQALT